MPKLLRYLFIGIVFPVLVQYVSYYQFTTNYTTNAFSEESFDRMYNTSVYKSRILGKELQTWTYHQLNSIEKFRNLRLADESNLMFSRSRLLHMDATADPVFYLSYFLLAALFSVLTALLLLKILDQEIFKLADQPGKDLAVMVFILFLGFTQFVVTPYDNPGYFFMAAGILFFLNYLNTRSSFALIALLITIAVATFNRETSLLILSFMAAVYCVRKGVQWNWVRQMILPVLCFLIPYLFLKFFYGGGAEITEASKLSVNLDIRNSYAIRGLAFGAFLLYFMLTTLNRNRNKLIPYFLLFSLPYIIIIHVVGVMIEYRLWLPVVLGAIVISFLPNQPLPAKKSIESKV
ncbi:MAG: hypothetical protein H0U44_01995 [Flavisolibacter sp.]|jgi:hypothetical protein|nr:hypothetical protein [Flavisolibacter sp.]